jgi:hypothetical protein
MTDAVHRRAWLRFVYLGALNAVVITALIVVGINYVQEQTRKICGLIVLLDDRNQQAPPKLPPNATQDQRDQYEVQQQFVAQVHAYRESINCAPSR